MKLGLLRDFAYLGVEKGGEGSGFAGHAGRPGEVGGSAPGEGGSSGQYKYSSDAKQRRESSNYPGNGPYMKVDEAIKEPIRTMNEDLKISTFASCEGHSNEWTRGDGMLGDRYEGNNLIGMNFQESYISANTTKAKDIEKFLMTKGFKIGSTERNSGGEINYDIIKKIDGGIISVDCHKGYSGRIAFRVRSRTLGYKECKFGDSPGFKNVVMSGKPKSQAEWDKMRDKGWQTVVSLLKEWKNGENK